MRAAGLEPLEPFHTTKTPWRSRCMTCGEEVAPRLNNVRSGHGGCLACGGKAPVDPDVAVAEMRAAGLEPLQPYRSTLTRWRCLCLECGDEVTPMLSVIRSGTGGCRRCGTAAARQTRFSREAPAAVSDMHAAGLKPLEPYPGSMRPWRSLHIACGATVTPRLNDVRRGSQGCRDCGNASSARKRRMQESEAIESLRAAGLEPLVPYRSGQYPWQCRCLTCGATVSPRLAAIRAGQGGCRPCGWDIGSSRRRDREAPRAEADMREAGLEPLEPYTTALTPWRCRCSTCHRTVTPRLNSVRSGQRGCIYCSNSSFALRGAAILYLITHEEYRAHKIGIMGQRTGRLMEHRRQGWTIFKAIDVPCYIDAYRAEQAVLRRLWNERQLLPCLTEEAMPQGGWTETVAAEDIGLIELLSLVEKELQSLSEDKISQ